MKYEDINYGERLKQFREKRGMSQRQFAEFCGTSQQQISNYEGQFDPPPWGTLKDICRALDIATWQFLAPENIVAGEIDPQLSDWIKIFRQIPDELQGLIIDSARITMTAYDAGSKRR